MRWTDSHCHLPYEGLEDVDAVVAAARSAGVERMVTVGTDLGQSEAAVEAAARVEGVWATVGLHPHDAVDGVGSLDVLLSPPHPKVVAIGECGLDYHYDHSPRDVQRSAFAQQIGLAHSLGLALVIHTREAWDDTFAILRSEGVPERTVFHCFTGGAREAEESLSLGAVLSFSGIVTFKGAEDVRDAVRVCPLGSLLVETDSPYLAPAPHRGKTNEPAFVSLVGAAVAAVKDVPVEEVASATWTTAERVLGLAEAVGTP